VDGQKFNDVNLFGADDMKVLQDDTSAAFSSGHVNLQGVTNTLSAAVGTAISTAGGAATALGLVKSAITSVAGHRATIGADLSRLMMTNDHLSVLSENLSASVSRIKDVDVATESAKYAKYNILVQSGTAMLAQANSLPQSALRLLQ